MNKKLSFTLVEILIVVVIIGILASALLPRLTGAQARARDAARKGHLSQISTSLSVIFQDESKYPQGECVSDISGLLIDYMNSVPSDPQANRITYGTKVGGCTGGIYGYSNLKKNSADEAGMVVVANTEEDGNYVISGSNPTADIFNPTEELTILEQSICKQVRKGGNDTVGCDQNNKVRKVKEVDRMIYVIFQ